MPKFAIPSFYMPNSKNEIIVSEIGFMADDVNDARVTADLAAQFVQMSGVSRTGKVYLIDTKAGGIIDKEGYLNIWNTPLGQLHIILISGPMYDMLKSKEGQYEEVLQIRKNPNYHEGNLTIH